MMSEKLFGGGCLYVAKDERERNTDILNINGNKFCARFDRCVDWKRCGVGIFLIAMLVMGIIILIFLVLYFGKEIFGILNNMIPFALETGWGFGSELGAFLGDIPLVGALCAFFFQLLGGLIGVAIMLEFCVLLPILLSLWLPIVPVLLHKKGII